MVNNDFFVPYNRFRRGLLKELSDSDATQSEVMFKVEAYLNAGYDLGFLSILDVHVELEQMHYDVFVENQERPN